MSISDSTERFLPIPGWPRYETSDFGRVRSRCGKRRSGQLEDGWLILKPQPSGPYGYLVVTLYKNGRGRHVNVAHLVLSAFVGERPPGQEVRHLDGDPTNNALSNLCYGTPLENAADKKRHGTENVGRRHGLAKLTEPVVAEIRRRRAMGEKPTALARVFGVSQGTISMACNGDRWTHVPVDPSLPKPPRNKLTEDQAREIKRRARAGEPREQIARGFNVTKHTVYEILSGRTWADLLA